jgi:hypothetical protein
MTERNRAIFGGPVDAIWIENMSTVLDDTRTLLLPGERVKLGGEPMGALFEIQDVNAASPATVSHCGIFWIDADKASRSSPTVHGASGHSKGAEEANGANDIIPAPRQTHIFVRMPHGTATLLVEPATSVAAVKARLAARVAIPVHQQRLLLAGRQLWDGDTLGREPMLHLDLMLRLCGGMDGASTEDDSDESASDFDDAPGQAGGSKREPVAAPGDAAGPRRGESSASTWAKHGRFVQNHERKVLNLHQISS